jgi:hypothetical protein
MSGLLDNWEPRHIEAFRAWEHGDYDLVCDLCNEEIEAEAKRFSRGLSKRDQITTESKIGEEVSQGLGSAYSYEECCQVGRSAVLGCLDRYDPSKGTVQGFVRKRIYYAMVDLLSEKQDPDPPDLSFGKAMEEFLASVERGVRDSWMFIEEVADYLDSITIKEWSIMIQRMDFEVVQYFWGFLHEFAEELASRIGASKRSEMSATATWRYFYSRFDQADREGVDLVDVHGPQYIEIVERALKAAGNFPAKIDDRAWGRMFGKDGKTIARWRERTAEAGAPPIIGEDGSVSLKSQEDHDAWTEYWMGVRDPRLRRRREKRRRQESK